MPDEYDNGPTFENSETEIWYDVDGEQHVLILVEE